jgi:DNA-binding FadR family transcriptional regulator
MARRFEDAMRELIDAIVTGEYEEGMRMPPETELRERLGVSRGALRDAMIGLEERKLVRADSGRGQTVCQREAWDTRFPDVLVACVLHGPDPDVLSHAIRARAVIEREAAAHASEFAAQTDFELLAARLAEMEQALEADQPRTFDADDPLVSAEVWFHRTLALLSDNPVLAKLVEPLHLPLAQFRRTKAPERDRAVVLHHRHILEGVSSREPELATEATDKYARQLVRWIGGRRF